MIRGVVSSALLLAALLVCVSPAAAAAGRFALLIGSNVGAPGDVPLRHARRDARQVADVLIQMGGFVHENIVVLADPTANRVREVLARLNARLRAETDASDDSLLVVFYSGHADAISLHLGATQLSWDELRNLTAGSAAAARLLVVDACRSGQATRVKGTKVGQPFALPPDGEQLPKGFAIISSAAAGELAQESDDLSGSFFSHHFAGALRGLADANGDGHVTVAEAFHYTSERTIAGTARTLEGIQHPTLSNPLILGQTFARRSRAA